MEMPLSRFAVRSVREITIKRRPTTKDCDLFAGGSDLLEMAAGT